MTEVDRQKLGKWLCRMVETPDSPANRLVVKHVAAGNKVGDELCKLALPEKLTDRAIEKIVGEVDEVTQNDIDGLGGTQKYLVCAKAGSESVGRFPITVISDASEAGDDLDTEPPTPQGLLAQNQRHLEAVMRTSAMASAQTIAHMQKENGRLAAENERLRQERFDQIEIYEDLKSKRHERELAATQDARRAEREGAVVDQILMLLPAAVNRLGGKKVLPENFSPVQLLTRQLMDSLSAAQVETLCAEDGAGLDAEQQKVFLKIYESQREKAPANMTLVGQLLVSIMVKPQQLEMLKGLFRQDQLMCLFEIFETMKKEHQEKAAAGAGAAAGGGTNGAAKPA